MHWQLFFFYLEIIKQLNGKVIVSSWQINDQSHTMSHKTSLITLSTFQRRQKQTKQPEKLSAVTHTQNQHRVFIQFNFNLRLITHSFCSQYFNSMDFSWQWLIFSSLFDTYEKMKRQKEKKNINVYYDCKKLDDLIWNCR